MPAGRPSSTPNSWSRACRPTGMASANLCLSRRLSAAMCCTRCRAASAPSRGRRRPRGSARRWPPWWREAKELGRSAGRRADQPAPHATSASSTPFVTPSIWPAWPASVSCVDFYSAWYERDLDRAGAREHRPRRPGADRRLQAGHLRHPEPLRHRRRRHPGGAAAGDGAGRRLRGPLRPRDPRADGSRRRATGRRSSAASSGPPRCSSASGRESGTDDVPTGVRLVELCPDRLGDDRAPDVGEYAGRLDAMPDRGRTDDGSLPEARRRQLDRALPAARHRAGLLRGLASRRSSTSWSGRRSSSGRGSRSGGSSRSPAPGSYFTKEIAVAEHLDHRRPRRGGRAGLSQHLPPPGQQAGLERLPRGGDERHRPAVRLQVPRLALRARRRLHVRRSRRASSSTSTRRTTGWCRCTATCSPGSSS